MEMEYLWETVTLETSDIHRHERSRMGISGFAFPLPFKNVRWIIYPVTVQIASDLC